MDFLSKLRDAQVGLAQQAAKANEYDKLVAARDAAYMANQYVNAGFQQGVEAARQQAPLYASDLRDNDVYNRLNYGADYSKQVPVQVPAGATTNGARLQPGPTAPTSSAVADYLAQKEAWRQTQSKGQ